IVKWGDHRAVHPDWQRLLREGLDKTRTRYGRATFEDATRIARSLRKSPMFRDAMAKGRPAVTNYRSTVPASGAFCVNAIVSAGLIGLTTCSEADAAEAYWLEQEVAWMHRPELSQDCKDCHFWYRVCLREAEELYPDRCFSPNREYREDRQELCRRNFD